MLMLVGIVVTNAIVLIDLINQYRKPHNGAPGMSVADAITHGARQRLRPILMTALATVFALTPMALGLTGGGGFISQPLAIVVIGGLVSSTALTLILVPVLYKLVEGRREKKQLLEELQHRPEVTPGKGNGGNGQDDFVDWTTGMVPRVTGRRAANNPAE
jgi:HAE1 family hydrophobic/amphiphilic exporter-1